MRILLILVVCISCSSHTWAQFELPGTDIWLLDIHAGQVTNIKPLIQRIGYDNQPSFSPDNTWVYYTRGELAEDGLGYTDIWRINLNSQQNEPVTHTTTSEFSPLPLPQTSGISTIQVQADGRQELWSFFPDSEQPQRRVISAEPVGYHAWLGADSLALFVLGDADKQEPNRLELWQPSSDSGMIISQDIGRGLQVSSNGELFFIQNPSQVTRLQLNKQPIPAIRLTEGAEDFALSADHIFWHGVGTKLYRRAPGMQGWQLAVDLQQKGLNGITRVAINTDGTQLAVVVND